jgi:hypothetical protein
VRVEPTKDDYRKYLKHPRGGGFPKEGPATWPDDRFTSRRIADGSVKVAGEGRGHHEAPRARLHREQQSA